MRNAKELKKCCICGTLFVGWGNNPWPIKEGGECCDECNSSRVVPARIRQMCVIVNTKNVD